MCIFNRPQPPPIPPPIPLPPAAKAPPAPVAPPKPAEPLQKSEPTNVKMQKSKRDAAGITSRGTSSLRIPLNQGSNSGGLNL